MDENFDKYSRTKSLTDDTFDKLAFDMEHMATALYYDYRSEISSAVDIQSLHTDFKLSRKSDALLLDVLGGEEAVCDKDDVLRIIRNVCGPDDNEDDDYEDLDVILRAWVAWSVCSQSEYKMRRESANPISPLRICL